MVPRTWAVTNPSAARVVAAFRIAAAAESVARTPDERGTMADTALTPVPRSDLLLPRLARFARSLGGEIALVRLGVGAVAFHIADDNFVQPEPGTSAGDHLASGLVPIAVLAVLAAVYPRLRAGARAATAMIFGGLAIAAAV